MTSTAALALSLSLAGGTFVAQDATVRPLLSKDLVGLPGKEITMITRLDRDAGQRWEARHTVAGPDLL